ncbi:acyl carrier protein [Gracilibacillus xinjiangensis]|uniref:Acyl carrier protein n=1 Tax=Gracilibacillus xinjiangensis TaxID=1193282 RepID=A0ABV8WRE5_9BACI
MTFEQFSRIVSEISHISIDHIQEESSFRDDLGIDSLQMVNLLVEISERIELDLNKINDSDTFSTPGKLFELISKGDTK